MERRTFFLFAAVLACCLLVAGGSLAQEGPAIGWSVLAGGGGPATGSGGLAFHDSLAQPVVGPASSGSVAVGAGYVYVTLPTGYQTYLPLVLRNR
jgi:hypothetical protein